MANNFEKEIQNLKQQIIDLYQKGQFKKAIDISIPFCEQIRLNHQEYNRDFAIILTSLAALHEALNNYEQAKKLLCEAKKIWLKIGGRKDPEYATTLSNLAMIYHVTGDFGKAERIFDKTLNIQRRILGENNLDYATTLSNQANTYYEKGDYENAKQLLLNAHKIWHKHKGEDDLYFAYSLNTLAAVYRDTHRYKKAEHLFLNALDIFNKVQGENGPDVAFTLTNLASLYYTRGDYKKAEPLLYKAAEIQHSTYSENHLLYATTLSNLGEMYRENGQYKKAEPLLYKALIIRTKLLGENHPDIAFSLNTLALLYVATGHKTKAMNFMKKASAITDRLIVEIFSVSSDSTRIAYLKSLNWFFHSFLSFVFQYNSTHDAVNEALDLILRRKALGTETLAIQHHILVSGKYPKIISKIRELNSLRNKINRKVLDGPSQEESLHEHKQNLNKWSLKRERLEKELILQIPKLDLEKNLHSTSVHTIADELPNGTALIEFVKLHLFDFKANSIYTKARSKSARYIAFILTGKGLKNLHMTDLGLAKNIDLLISKFIMSLTVKSTTGYIDNNTQISKEPNRSTIHIGCALRTAIFDPLKPFLNEFKTIFVAPDGDLTRLPFETLPTTEDGHHFLIDDYSIRYLSTGRDLLRFGTIVAASSNKPLVAADPDFDLGSNSRRKKLTVTVEVENFQSNDLEANVDHFESLKETRKEGKKIASMLGIQPLLGKRVLETKIKECKSPSILHLATHGFFLANQRYDLNEDKIGFGIIRGVSLIERLSSKRLENPLLRSGLALAGANTWLQHNLPPSEVEDGILNGEDVSALDLSNTNLVVLSACETGLGDILIGEGVFGLRRSFVVAGAQTLVMSLWKVTDRETRKLMIDFYRKILAGKSRAEALREAQLAIKEKYPNPYYWGAFICQGDPGPLSNANFASNS